MEPVDPRTATRFILEGRLEGEIKKDAHRYDAVHAVEHAPVPGDEVSHVLDLEVPLVQGGGQVAHEVEDADAGRQDEDEPQGPGEVEGQEVVVAQEEQDPAEDARPDAARQAFDGLFRAQPRGQDAPAEVLAHVVRTGVRPEGADDAEEHPEPAVGAVPQEDPEALERQGVDEPRHGRAQLQGVRPAFFEKEQRGGHHGQRRAQQGEEGSGKGARVYSIKVWEGAGDANPAQELRLPVDAHPVELEEAHRQHHEGHEKERHGRAEYRGQGKDHDEDEGAEEAFHGVSLPCTCSGVIPNRR